MSGWRDHQNLQLARPLRHICQGTPGWVRCWWCEYWVHWPYFHDWDDYTSNPICPMCFDRYVEVRRPWAPSALDHRVNYIWYVIPDIRDFPLEILRLIGNFITPWWWPGRGSRTVPVAEATRTSRDVWYGRGPRNGRSPDPVQPRVERRRRRSPAPSLDRRPSRLGR